MDRLDSATPFSPAPQQEFPDLDSLITSLATHPVKLAFQKFPMSKRFECGMTCCSMPVLKLVFNRVHYRAHMLTIVIGLSLPIPTLTGPTSSVLRSAHWVSATGRVQLLKARLEVRRFLAHLLRPGANCYHRSVDVPKGIQHTKEEDLPGLRPSGRKAIDQSTHWVGGVLRIKIRIQMSAQR